MGHGGGVATYGPMGPPVLGPKAGRPATLIHPTCYTLNAWGRLAQGACSAGLLVPFCSPPPALSSLLLSPHSGTFNPSFDGQPRKDFFHILNLLAPANHLNLPPSALPAGVSLKTQGTFLILRRSPWGGLSTPPPLPEFFLRRLLCAVSW